MLYLNLQMDVNKTGGSVVFSYLVSLHTIWYLFNFIIIVIFSLFGEIKLAGILLREAIGLIESQAHRTLHVFSVAGSQ